MEVSLHRLFTARSDFPIWVRYTLTLGLVGIAFFARVMLDDHLRSYPVLLFIPAIFLSSVLFDRGSGIVATAAAAALAAAYFMPGPPSSAAIPLVLFVLTGICIAAVTELLRHALQNLAEAKRYSEVLLQELAHRTRNDLATIVSILRLQARSATDPAVQAAIASAVSRVDVVAKVHDRLRDTADCQSAFEWDPLSASKRGSDSFLMKFAGRLWFSNGESAPCGRAFKSHRWYRAVWCLMV